MTDWIQDMNRCTGPASWDRKSDIQKAEQITAEDLDALIRDAMRYRWIRGKDSESTRYSRWRVEYFDGQNGWTPMQRERMDDAVDAAMDREASA